MGLLGQPVAVAPRAQAAARLAERCGDPLPGACGAVTALFPVTEALAELVSGELRCRGRAAGAGRGLAADRAAGLGTPATARKLLEQRPGIGLGSPNTCHALSATATSARN
jgi:3-methyladenine DNA glycosylase/8-oxoguanine DNA glycosylase